MLSVRFAAPESLLRHYSVTLTNYPGGQVHLGRGIRVLAQGFG
jgi:hypothetical protein